MWREYVAVLLSALTAFYFQDFVGSFVQVNLPFNFGHAALTAIIAVIIFGGLIYGEFFTSAYYKNVGSFLSQKEGERASIKCLAKEIGLRPWKLTFQINWECNGNGCGMKNRATIYDRKHKIIGYEEDVGSGYAKSWECPNDQKIFAVANKNGTLSDFAL